MGAAEVKADRDEARIKARLAERSKAKGGGVKPSPKPKVKKGK